MYNIHVHVSVRYQGTCMGGGMYVVELRLHVNAIPVPFLLPAYVVRQKRLRF